MSVAELQARLAKLSTEIDLQKEVLKKLEHDKSLVQQQLNAVLDPMARLPLEISSEIFLLCLPPLRLAAPHASRAPMLLLNICNAWSDIALSTPALWAAVHIAFPCAEGMKEVLRTWLRRACNHLLSVSLRGTLDQGVAAIIWQSGRQLRHLEIYDCDEVAEYDSDGILVDLFGDATPGPLPLLETLIIRGCLHGREFSGSEILDLLGLAPNLAECIFDSVAIGAPFVVSTEILVLPNLRRLKFGRAARPTSQDDLLKCLSLPAVDSLSLSLYGVSAGDFLSFLKRSSPRLRSLALNQLGFTHLEEALHWLVPTLTRLEVWWRGCSLAEGVFAAMAKSPSLLPKLRRLIIHLELIDVVTDSFWRIVLDAVRARRTQLKDVRIYGILSTLSLPGDILTALRELQGDGMKIWIGTPKNNFVSV